MLASQTLQCPFRSLNLCSKHRAFLNLEKAHIGLIEVRAIQALAQSLAACLTVVKLKFETVDAAFCVLEFILKVNLS